jgi:excinuclease ABC subunit C
MEDDSMTKRLEAFVETHPDGWNHSEWLSLLSELREAGVDVSEPDDLGTELERMRLAKELQRRSVPGLGPKRCGALIDRFGSLWKLQHASVDDLAGVPSINRALAEKVLKAIH